MLRRGSFSARRRSRIDARDFGPDERLAQPLERGRLLIAVGILQRRLKDRRAAREALTLAHALFDSIGATAWAARATAEAARISGRRPQPSLLTPTEQRVAERAATGRTNKEIAAEMHLSVKAVEANLSRVYRKLAIRRRGELAVRLPGRESVPATTLHFPADDGLGARHR